MEDHQIIELYFRRSEQAIAETADKYGRYCHTIANHVLGNPEDAEECVNDTWLHTWNAIPPTRPSCFRAFLGRITRNLSINRFLGRTAVKRGGGETAAALDELKDCVAAEETVESVIDERELGRAISAFLETLPEKKRVIFVRRYWYLCPIAEIASSLGEGESMVKMSLSRMRRKLRDYLEQEGIAV
jgi:RNA polymerase sigma factor (sigma-70 family)